MPQVAGICQSCGAVSPSGIVVDDSTDITFQNVTSRCIRCGGLARIPDGTFDFLGSTMRIVTASRRSIEDLKHLERVLRHARDNRYSHRRILSTVRTETPWFVSVVEGLKDRENRTEMYKVLGLIIALLVYLSNMGGCDGDSKQIERVLQEFLRRPEIRELVG